MPQLEPFFNPWEDYKEHLYNIYEQTFLNANLTFRGLPVRSKYHPEYDNKGFSFWHIISTGLSEEDREPDLQRCERIRWVGWIIQNIETSDDLSWWENKRGSNTHIVLLWENKRYVVILAKRKNYYLLKTAYPIQSQNKIEKLKRERDDFWNTHKS